MRHHITSAVVIGTLLAMPILVLAQTWTAAPANPPASNAAAPINVSSTAQTKAGDFGTDGKFSVGGSSAFGGYINSLGGLGAIGTGCCGAEIGFTNTDKTATNIGNTWRIYNMSAASGYANMLAFDVYGGGGNPCGTGGLCAENFAIYDNGTVYVPGNLGIGVIGASSGSSLEVAGQVKITGGSPGAGKVLTSDASGLASWVAPSGGGGQWTTSGNNIYNNNTGNVGIGTQGSGSYKLDVAGGGIRVTDNVSNAYPLVVSNSADSVFMFGIMGATKGMRIGTNSTKTSIEGTDNTLFSSYQPISLGGSYVSTENNGAEVMRVTGGQVGIGTPSPAQKLTVAGNINKANSWILGDSVWGGSSMEVHANGWDGVSNGTYGTIVGGHGYYYGGLQSGGPNGNEAGGGQLYVAGNSMLLGSVGVGYTSPGSKLDVNGAVRAHDGFTGDAAANYGGTGAAAYLPNGAWLNGPNEWIYGNVYFSGGLYENTGNDRWHIRSDIGEVKGTTLCIASDCRSSWPSGGGGGGGTVTSIGNGSNTTVSGTAAVPIVNVVNAPTFSGNVTAAAYYYSSDKSLKTNIADLDPNTSLKNILDLQGVSFNWKKDGAASVGLVAQDVEKVYPELVQTDPTTGLKSVEYGNLVAPLIEAVKAQQKEIDALKAEVEALKAAK